MMTEDSLQVKAEIPREKFMLWNWWALNKQRNSFLLLAVISASVKGNVYKNA